MEKEAEYGKLHPDRYVRQQIINQQDVEQDEQIIVCPFPGFYQNKKQENDNDPYPY